MLKTFSIAIMNKSTEYSKWTDVSNQQFWSSNEHQLVSQRVVCVLCWQGDKLFSLCHCNRLRIPFWQWEDDATSFGFFNPNYSYLFLSWFSVSARTHSINNNMICSMRNEDHKCSGYRKENHLSKTHPILTGPLTSTTWPGSQLPTADDTKPPFMDWWDILIVENTQPSTQNLTGQSPVN